MDKGLKDLEALHSHSLEPLQASNAHVAAQVPLLAPKMPSTQLFPRPWRDVLRPEFPHIWSSPLPLLKSTAYLDGLRGVAAMVVYIVHAITWSHDVERVHWGFGWAGQYSFIHIPFLRVFLSNGHNAVAIFFVISGFVLSYRPLMLIHNHSDAVYPALSSALFRRGIRLYVPFVGFTVACFTLWHLLRTNLDYPIKQATYFGEWQNFIREFVPYVSLFKRPDTRWFSYNMTLWTIPIEYQGSILCYSTLLAFSRLHMRARVALTLSLALYLLYIGVWSMFLFLAGQVVADYYVLRTIRPALPNFIHHVGDPSHPYKTRILDIGVFCAGMWLASQPSGANRQIAIDTPGYAWLARHVPQQYVAEEWFRFWLAIGAPIVLVGVTNVHFLRRALESRLAQYLGRISFGLYLVHMPIGVSIGDTLFRMNGFVRPYTQAKVWDHWFKLPSVGPFGFETDFLLLQLIILPITLYASEIVMKLMDEPSVVLGKRIHEAFMVDW